MTTPVERKGDPGPLGFGARITDLREARGLLQREAAEGVRLCQATLGKYEVGAAYPGYWNLVEIAKFYNVDMAWLTGMPAPNRG